MYPADYRYTKDHEWVRADGSAAIVGITDYAQHQLGDVVFVELPQVGAKIEAGERLGTVESVKAVSDIFSPVSGEVIETNSALSDSPEKINQDPHGSAWMVKLRMADSNELSALMDAAAYKSYVAEKTEGNPA